MSNKQTALEAFFDKMTEIKKLMDKLETARVKSNFNLGDGDINWADVGNLEEILGAFKTAAHWANIPGYIQE